MTQRPEALDQTAAALGRRVWEPLRPHLGDARTVLIAPDGGLSFFPFAALPGSRPGSYLIEDLAIGYVASGRSRHRRRCRPHRTGRRGLLAVGDVDFQADPGQPSPDRPHGLAASPWSRSAAGSGRCRGPAPRPVAPATCSTPPSPDQPAELLTRAEPTEAEIKRRLDGGHWRVVHLGTHGFFESPARVAALRAAGPPRGARRPSPRKPPRRARMRPRLRADAALASRASCWPAAAATRAPAGPMRPPTRRREDGILTAEEVQALDLRGTELVVLSACETGLGEAEYGQGVLGLQRAFQAAGARAVVASLWKVDDAATTVLMEQFYTNLWDKKLPKLEALRQAQLDRAERPGAGASASGGAGEAARDRREAGEAAGGRAVAPTDARARAERSLALGRLRPERRWAVSDRAGTWAYRPARRFTSSPLEPLNRGGRT